MNPLSFCQWKRNFLKDRVCNNKDEITLWLEARNIMKIPSIVAKYSGWICKSDTLKKVYLSRFKLILKIRGFKKPYRRVVLSLLPIKFMIKREYFNIFGNTCKLVHTDIRTIERNPLPTLCIRFSVITAIVEPQYKEERSGYTISNFYCNAKKRRHSDSEIPFISRRLSDKVKASRMPRLKLNPKKLSLRDLTQRYRWSTVEYHKKLVHYFTENIEKNVHNPRLVLMFGVPGSGKNWVLKKRRKKNHVIINMDDCLAMLPDYWRGMLELQERDKRAHDWIQTFRAECRSIATQLFRFALDNKMNIVWNGTGKNLKKYERLIQEAKKRGYIIELNGIWVPLKLAKKRLKERRDSYGRPVPDEVFNMAAFQIPTAFKKLRETADYARIWKNEPGTPRLIWDKDQGWIDRKGNIQSKMGWVSPTHYTSNNS